MNSINKYLMPVTFFLLLSAGLITGCAPEVVVPQERYFWPPPPDQPRIEWLRAYSSQLDLKMTIMRRIKVFIVGEDSLDSLKKPAEVRADSVNEKIYVADLDRAGVYVFDLKQGESRMISTIGSGLPEKISPIGLALDRDNNLYILEPRHRKILVYNSAENYIRTISLEKICQRPIALAIDKKKGRLYVSDIKLNKVVALDVNGDTLFSFGGPGAGEGTFNMPVSIAINSSGEIVVADSFNARIQVFSDTGVFVRAFGRRGDRAGDFQLIKSVAVDTDDNVYVVDGRSHAVNIFSKTGERLMSLGSFYSVSSTGKMAPGGFLMPVGIDIDATGKIYVADQLNARIQVFQYLPETANPVGPSQAK